MNRKTLIVLAIAAVSAGTALADDITIDNSRFESTATRAQVQGELAAYKKAGVNPWSNRYNPLAQFRSQRSRADVTAEYLGSRERVAAFTGEDSGSRFLAANRTQRTSETVAGRPVNAQ